MLRCDYYQPMKNVMKWLIMPSSECDAIQKLILSLNQFCIHLIYHIFLFDAWSWISTLQPRECLYLINLSEWINEWINLLGSGWLLLNSISNVLFFVCLFLLLRFLNIHSNKMCVIFLRAHFNSYFYIIIIIIIRIDYDSTHAIDSAKRGEEKKMAAKKRKTNWRAKTIFRL